jgi:hypothetical protein
LRSLWGNPWKFESSRPHHHFSDDYQSSEQAVPAGLDSLSLAGPAGFFQDFTEDCAALLQSIAKPAIQDGCIAVRPEARMGGRAHFAMLPGRPQFGSSFRRVWLSLQAAAVLPL